MLIWIIAIVALVLWIVLPFLMFDSILHILKDD